MKQTKPRLEQTLCLSPSSAIHFISLLGNREWNGCIGLSTPEERCNCYMYILRDLPPRWCGVGNHTQAHASLEYVCACVRADELSHADVSTHRLRLYVVARSGNYVPANRAGIGETSSQKQ